jgi:hypothetical protein
MVAEAQDQAAQVFSGSLLSSLLFALHIDDAFEGGTLCITHNKINDLYPSAERSQCHVD